MSSKFWSTPQDFFDFFCPRPLPKGHRRVKNMNISDFPNFLFENLLISEVFQQQVKEDNISFPNLLEFWEKLVWRRSYSYFCVTNRSGNRKSNIKTLSSPSTTTLKLWKLWNDRSRSSGGVGCSNFYRIPILTQSLKIWHGFWEIWCGFHQFWSRNFKVIVLKAQKELVVQILSQ